MCPKQDENVIFTDTAPCALVKELKKQQGKDIWICGGANLICQLAQLVYEGKQYLFRQISEAEYCRTVGWKRVGEGIGLTVTFALFGAVHMYIVTFFIEAMSAVQNQSEVAPFGNSYPVIIPGHRGKIDDEEEILFPRFISSDKAENTAVSIIGVDPLKPFAVIVQSGQTGVLSVECEKTAYIMKQIFVKRLIGQIPVEGLFFIPFMELSKVLSHKEKLLSWMSYHKGVSGLQIGKFVLIAARHLVDHGTFQVYYLVMGENENEVFAGGIGKAEGHLIVVEFPVNRI